MNQAPFGQPVDVPSSRLLRQPWSHTQEAPVSNEGLAEEAAAALSEIDDDAAEELIAALVTHLAANAMDARLRGTRSSPLQRFERRLRKSVDTFNRQFG